MIQACLLKLRFRRYAVVIFDLQIGRTFSNQFNHKVIAFHFYWYLSSRNTSTFSRHHTMPWEDHKYIFLFLLQTRIIFPMRIYFLNACKWDYVLFCTKLVVPLSVQQFMYWTSLRNTQWTNFQSINKLSRQLHVNEMTACGFCVFCIR